MLTRATERFAQAGINPVFDHLAVAAPRIRDLLPIYFELLHGQFLEGGDDTSYGFRSMQLTYPGGKIELLEPLAGSTFFDRFFGATGGGVHHVTFTVPDIYGAIEALTAAEIGATSPQVHDPGWREVFIHPREAFGTLIQLAQPGPRSEMRMTMEDVLRGTGRDGTGVPSP